jgi:hypothetical protein
MSTAKLTAGLTVSAFIAYLVFATIDTKYGLSFRLSEFLPGPNSA